MKQQTYKKTRKMKQIYKKTRKIQRGGENIDVKHIMLNRSMQGALRTRFPDKESIRRNGYFPLPLSIEEGVGGLARMDRMMELTPEKFDNLLANDPPKLKKRAKTKNGVELYEVIDGRHRVVRAILNGKNKIPFVKA